MVTICSFCGHYLRSALNGGQNEQKKIAGIDYSLTSPAICVYKEEDGGFFDFDRCVLHYLSNNKRQQQLAAGCGLDNIKAEPYPEWNCEEERHEKLATWAYY